MDLYGPILRNVLFPTWESAIRRRPTMAHLRDLEKSQWYSRDELLALQAKLLRRLIRHAHLNVPYYRKRFEAAGITPEDIQGPEDLHKLPILEHGPARENVEERTSTAPPYVAVRKNTSGTMGRPLRIGYNIESEFWRNAVKLRGYGWAGYKIGARSLHYWGQAEGRPVGLKTRGKIELSRRLKREIYVDCTPRGDDDLENVVRQIRRSRPDVIVTYAQAGATLARYIVESGSRSWDTIPVICGAERLFDADREALKEAFGDAVFETYGSREVMLIGAECEAHDGLHVSMENLIVEIVVREEGVERPARPGETGEVVITDLHNLAVPFIRYTNGDLAVARQPDRCACGRELIRIGPVEGRVSETLRDGYGNRVSGLVFNLIFVELAKATSQFQAVQHLDGSITLRVVPTKTFTDADRERLHRHCAKYLPGVRIRTELVEDLPVDRSAKRRVVIVERSN